MAYNLASHAADTARALREQQQAFLTEMTERHAAQERRQAFMAQAAQSMASDVSIARALAERFVSQRSQNVQVNNFREGDFNMFVNQYYHDHGPRIAALNVNHVNLRKQLLQFYEAKRRPPASSRAPWERPYLAERQPLVAVKPLDHKDWSTTQCLSQKTPAERRRGALLLRPAGEPCRPRQLQYD